MSHHETIQFFIFSYCFYVQFISLKFQDRLQRDMTAEIDHDETATTIAKELLDLGLVHEVDCFDCVLK